ncbi:MAG: trypsin-like peptidase domain-containing protein [Clostridiales Family XIII bacterium]|jgi:S1-C subfamily serine protease|nr:trypsin-like peptidase domain-containing protein [Clostridiales Family XIII bacterium]
MKRICVTAIVFLLFGLFPASTLSAADAGHAPQAEALKELGLFLGTDKGLELERGITRAESAVMTVRLLGKENEAKSANLPHPFKDVPQWASAYVGYIYSNNITKGVSDDSFGSNQAATATHYATFVLRALGYDDGKGDFSWDKALDKMVSLGIADAGQLADIQPAAGMLRGEAAFLSYLSLFAARKGSGQTLLEKLFVDDRAITAARLRAASAIDRRVLIASNILGVGAPQSVGEPLNSEEIFKKASAAIFKVNVKFLSGSDFGTASGFFISPDGVAVTNKHVISLMSSSSITAADGKTYPVEGVIAISSEADIAVIKVKGSGFPYLEVGDPTLLRTAQRIYCLGSPSGFENTISDGLVSSINREYEGKNYIQISAPIGPGSSGGALLNEYGQVVGVTTAYITTQGIIGGATAPIGLATPIGEISKAYKFKEMRSAKYLQAHVSSGWVPVVPESRIHKEAESVDGEAAQIIESDSIMRGTIKDAGDVDSYALDVKEKADIFVSLTSDVAHSTGLKLEILDPSGAVVMKSRHYKGELFSLAEGLGSAVGKYTARIYVEDGGEGWDDVQYELYWGYQPIYDVSSIQRVCFEFEPNDSPEHANYLPDYANCYASFSDKNDVDYYTFTIDGRLWYYADIELLGEEKKIKADVFDADNKHMGAFETEYDGCLSFDKILPAGTYYIKVTTNDAGAKWENDLYLISGYWYED